MKFIVVSNGNICDFSLIRKVIDKDAIIICADGGARYLFKMNILPHVIIGDLDSLDEELKDFFKKKNVDFYKFPQKKDYTDTELAIEYALSKGATEIIFLGAIGSRMDHTIANITLLLPLVKKGIKAKVIDDYNEIVIVNKDLKIKGEIGEILSIIPISEKVEGITLKGLEYPLNDATISMGETIGISNRFIETQAKISIKKGNILVIKARD
ncbi:thiamine diphosphokinase [Crassaminicella thermophila]|uniref:Thiamine diphosphokinase n=1 Tax=Crassaminicella thermophila TaxID=2599308 RepID=A0A5C0SBR8_CRATE|nr:thiamine diphosphokinase [Crassaminicella thermophila]QEK12003.1 thiamine diphosphokinase [Crassaminicella thermophila]